jgi:transcriptional repressor NrdR
MKCPYCGYDDSKVIDSRNVDDSVRRRRRCLECERRFTTYERIEPYGLVVIKKDGRRENFSRNKLLAGIRKACEKRPLAVETVERIVDGIETAVQQMGKLEVPSSLIGEMVMERLRQLDEIAYIRFASVYRAFKDIDGLREELEHLDRVRQAAAARNQPPLFPQEDLEAMRRRLDAAAVPAPARGRPGRKPKQAGPA